jgi:hypothetical protein
VRNLLKRFLKRFLSLFHMEQNQLTYPEVPNFIDLGVLYSRGEGFLPARAMERTTRRKARIGTYRFNSNGTYYFSKRDSGKEVIISFLERGQPRRQVYTIGL